MAKRKDRYLLMLAAVGLVAASACGCAGGAAVDHDGN